MLDADRRIVATNAFARERLTLAEGTVFEGGTEGEGEIGGQRIRLSSCATPGGTIVALEPHSSCKAAERLQTLLEACGEGLVVVERLAIIDWTPPFERLVRVRSLQGRSLLDFVVPHGRSAVEERIRNEWPVPYESELRREDGSVVPVEICGQAVLWEGRTVYVAAFHDITHRKKTQEALQRSEQRFRLLVEGIHDCAIFMVDPDGTVMSWNSGAERLWGYPDTEALGRPVSFLYLPGDVAAGKPDEELAAARKQERVEGDGWRVRRDGSRIWVEALTNAVRDEQGRLRGFACIIRDRTEKRRTEEALRQSREHLWQLQKMDMSGRLASGIAHDFNNLLSVILGFTELALLRVPADLPIRDHLEEVRKAGNRATALTKQLLVFSRRELPLPAVVDLNSILVDLEAMLRRLMPENIRLELITSETPCFIRTDPTQMQQVILNLAVNARDAMAGGGKLTLETRRVLLDEAAAHLSAGAKPGPHVVLLVSDTGIGMDRGTLARIYEPFFTTKPKGKGTGLGLTTVQAIVGHHGGHLWVYSEPGHGTTFKVYFPLEPAAGSASGTAVAPEPARGSETILLAEDDAAVRAMAREILHQAGYAVLEAATGEEAMRIGNRLPVAIQLLITDSMMPDLTGRELSARLSTSRPDLRILHISGYSERVAVERGYIDPGASFLEKPFSREDLLAAVRRLLDRPA